MASRSEVTRNSTLTSLYKFELPPLSLRESLQEPATWAATRTVTSVGYVGHSSERNMMNHWSLVLTWM